MGGKEAWCRAGKFPSVLIPSFAQSLNGRQMPLSSRSEQTRLHSLDRLRGICALWVFGTHWLLWNYAGSAGSMLSTIFETARAVYEAVSSVTWPQGGQHPAVVCFFVLSGFCVHGGFEKRRRAGGTIDWPEYGKRRFARIMPVYWAGALLGLIVVVLQHWVPVDHALLWFHSQAEGGEIAARLFGYGGLWPREVFVGNQTLGTVAVEMVIYAGYPLFFSLTQRKGGWWIGGIVASVAYIASMWLDDFIDPYVVYASVVVGALLWFCGAWIARVYYRGGRSISGLWVLAAWVLFAFMNQQPMHVGGGLLRQAVWAVLCSLFIYWLVTRERDRGLEVESKTARVLRWWGGISYPLYAIHTPIILIVIWSGGGATGQWPFVYQAVASFVLPVVVAQFVHRQIENRFLRSRKNKSA